MEYVIFLVDITRKPIKEMSTTLVNKG